MGHAPLENQVEVSDVSRIKSRVINRLEVDQAVFYSLCLRMWQLVVHGHCVLDRDIFQPRRAGVALHVWQFDSAELL